MYYLWTFLFSLVWIAEWFLTLAGLPGNWAIVLTAGLFALIFPREGTHGMNGWWIVALALLAGTGEAVELIAGAAGVSRGGSRRGAWLAMVGSILGSILGAGVGIPIPLVGPLVGMLVFSALGAMIGAILGEWGREASHGKKLKIGTAAFWGRLFGSLSKILIGSVMVGVAISGALS